MNGNSKNILIVAESAETKLQQLINELLRLINTTYSEGDVLPSVNSLSKELNISRDTVFKAYSELKRRQIVGSTPTKGYFVERELNKVLLLLDYYSPYKDIVYREIEKNVDSSYSIDLVFHHFNKNLFESVILESSGRYNAYIVMNYDSQKLEIAESLKKIPPSKLLLLDLPIENWKDFDKEKYSYIWQNFNEVVYDVLIKIKDKISKYNNFQLINPRQSQHPAITLNAYHKFCTNYKIQSKVIRNSNDTEVKAGDAYFVLRQGDLHNILSQCKAKNLEPGKNVGLLAYNDFPLYEFVSCGITVISTDFKKMGQLACQFINEGKNMKETVPTKIILRNSL